MKIKSHIWLIALGMVLGLLSACNEDEAAVIPEQATVEFTWDGKTINLAEMPEWCLTRSNTWVAVTNVDKKSQFHLNWDGGMNPGIKDNARLKISSNGNLPVEYVLSTFEIITDGMNYTYSFADANGSRGSFTFPLETE